MPIAGSVRKPSGAVSADQDRYWHVRRKAEQAGMVGGALDVAICTKCASISPVSELVRVTIYLTDPSD